MRGPPAYPQLSQGLVQQFGLRNRSPGTPPRPFAVAVSGAVEDAHAAGSEQTLGHATGVVVVTGHDVAVDQDDGSPATSVTCSRTPSTSMIEPLGGGRSQVPRLSLGAHSTPCERRGSLAATGQAAFSPHEIGRFPNLAFFHLDNAR
jgi:hypothetical protein